MTDRDRLIDLIANADTHDSSECKLCTKDNDACDCCYAEKLADHLLANGVIVPPCKVEDMVYQVKYCRCGNSECFEMKHCYKKDTKRTPKVIDSIMLVQKGKRLIAPYKFEWKPVGTICYKIIQKPFKLEWLTEVGKTVFLTKEEAKAKLKELGKQ